MKLLRFKSLYSRRLRPRHYERVFEVQDLLELVHWADKPILRIDIPTKLLRMQGGLIFDEGHPFVQAITSGRSALEQFYKETCPANIAEYYGIEAKGRTGENLPPWEIPWYLRTLRAPPPGELGLGAEHGVSFFGPASENKVNLEFRRITGIAKSIRRNGFDPDNHGDIAGYVMRHKEQACFFVRGGKHRTAALAELGYETIPVAFREGFPRVVDTGLVDSWPLVRSDAMEKGLAQEIFLAYIQGRIVKGGRIYEPTT